MTKSKVTILCVTYNHEKFIAQALDSFVMQKTNFEYEVMVADDCSTDNTSQIVLNYAEKYPDIIKPLIRTQNIGATANYLDVIPLINSVYVCMCEGDDYFTDENKLQKQADFLDQNQDFSICFHRTLCKYENGERSNYTIPTEENISTASEEALKDLLFYSSNYIATSSVMYRWDHDLHQDFPTDIQPGDWYIHMLFAKNGKIGFIDELMSVYRINNTGFWYDANIGNIYQHFVKFNNKEMRFFKNVYNKLAPNKIKYFKKQIIPYLSRVLFTYIYNNDTNNIKKIKKSHPLFYYITALTLLFDRFLRRSLFFGGNYYLLKGILNDKK